MPEQRATAPRANPTRHLLARAAAATALTLALGACAAQQQQQTVAPPPPPPQPQVTVTAPPPPAPVTTVPMGQVAPPPQPVAPPPQPVAPPPVAPPPQAVVTPPPAGARVHTVVVNDTVYNLARRYQTTQEAIVAANGIGPDYRIRLGQQLTIPTAYQGPIQPAPPRAGATPPPPQPVLQTSATPPPAGGPSRLARPVQGRITRAYGAVVDGAASEGVGIAAPAGAPVFAADGGTVAFVSAPSPQIGSVVMISHPGGMVTIYGRVTNLQVAANQTVSRGQPIAQVAQNPSGASFLHFEVRNGAQPIDPTPFL